MKTICIIIDGIQLPYHVVNFAIEKAKKESYKIFAIFLKGTAEPSKGYLYPSDLSTIEKGESNQESLNEDEQIIIDNMKLVEKMAKDENVLYSATIKTDLSIAEVKKIVADADLIAIDENFNRASLLSDNKIT
jgi:hypothetical protein